MLGISVYPSERPWPIIVRRFQCPTSKTLVLKPWWARESSWESFVYFYLLSFCLFYFLLCWVFITLCGFFWLQQVGVTLRYCAWASHFGGFSCGAQALGAWASGVAAHGLSSCGSWALEGTSFSSCGTRLQLSQLVGLERLVVAAHGLSCFTACGVFPDQGSNLCPLHCRWILVCSATREVQAETLLNGGI